MDREISGKQLKSLAPPIISTLLFLLAVSLFNLQQFLEALQTVDKTVFLLAVFVGNMPFLLNAVIWQNSLEFLGYRENISETLKLQYSMVFINNITPLGNFGGEPAIAYKISNEIETGYEKILATVIFTDKIIFLPMIVFLPFSIIFITLNPGKIPVNILYSLKIALSVLLLFLSVFIVFYWLYTRERLENTAKLKDSISNRLPYLHGIGDLWENFSQGFKVYNSKKLPAVHIVFASSSFLLDVLCLYLVVLSVSPGIGFLTAVAIMPISRLANFAPSPGGSGFYELTLTGLLISLTDLTVAQGASASILYRVATFYIGILIGYISLNID